MQQRTRWKVKHRGLDCLGVPTQTGAWRLSCVSKQVNPRVKRPHISYSNIPSHSQRNSNIFIIRLVFSKTLKLKEHFDRTDKEVVSHVYAFKAEISKQFSIVFDVWLLEITHWYTSTMGKIKQGRRKYKCKV